MRRDASEDAPEGYGGVRMASLYELTEEYAALQDMIYDPEVDAQTLHDTIEMIDMEFEDKADNFAKLIRNMNAEVEMIKAEEERLHMRRKTLENRSRYLKDILEGSMQVIGKTKFKTALFSFIIQKNGGLEPLVIDGTLDDIPGRYLIPQPPVPNNEEIRKLLKEQFVSWAHLEPRGESLRIR